MTSFDVVRLLIKQSVYIEENAVTCEGRRTITSSTSYDSQVMTHMQLIYTLDLSLRTATIMRNETRMCTTILNEVLLFFVKRNVNSAGRLGPRKWTNFSPVVWQATVNYGSELYRIYLYLLQSNERLNSSQSKERIFSHTIGDWLERRLWTNSPPLISVRYIYYLNVMSVAQTCDDSIKVIIHQLDLLMNGHAFNFKPFWLFEIIIKVFWQT